MNQLKISTRILLMLSVLATLLIFIGLLGLYGMSQTNERMRSIYEDRAVPLKQLGDINYLANRNRILVMDMMLVLAREGEQSQLDKRYSELQKNQVELLAIWKAFKATKMTPEEAQLATEMEKVGLSYTRQRPNCPQPKPWLRATWPRGADCMKARSAHRPRFSIRTSMP